MALEALKQAIEREGRAIGTDIVKLDGFLNHRIDLALTAQMGQAIRDAFAGEQIDAVLTIEASGIAPAMMVAQAFGNVPLIYAKKGEPSNIGGDVYRAEVYSFTRRQSYPITVSRAYLQAGMRVLLVDDFLASGAAMEGLLSICRQARCEVAGVGICVEKGFQSGGTMLRAQGLRVVSLAIVDAIRDGKVVLRKD